MSLSRKHPKKKLKLNAHCNENESLLHPTATVPGIEQTESISEHESERFRRATAVGYPISGDAASSSQIGFRGSNEHSEIHPHFLQPGRAMVWNYPFPTENPYYVYPYSQHPHGGYFHEESTQPHVFGPQPPFYLLPDHSVPPMASSSAYYNPSNTIMEDGRTGSEAEAYQSAYDNFRYAPDTDNYNSVKDGKQMVTDPLLTAREKKRTAEGVVSSRSSKSNIENKKLPFSIVTRMTTTVGAHIDKPATSSSSLAATAASTFRRQRRENSRSGAILRARLHRYQEERARVRHFRMLGMTLLAERLLSPDRFQELQQAIRAQQEEEKEEERTGGGGVDDEGTLEEAKDSRDMESTLYTPGFTGL